VSRACLQTPLDAERFVRLGLPRERIRVTGNLKFAASAAATACDPHPILSTLGVGAEDELWVAGSTAEGEEAAILDAFAHLPPPVRGRRLLVIAPRHAERFEAAAKIAAASGLSWVRRSHDPSGERSSRAAGHRPPEGGARVILLDTLGELPLLYAAATVAFVGGSLVPVGGHNIIEPAANGVAPVFGPHIQNFREAAALLLEAGGAFQVWNAGELKDLFARLASDETLRRNSGERAKKVVLENSGSLDATIREILPYLRPARPARA
jgi:3-deoxy-D-manno-octulosonic-acid transferase